MRDFHLSFHKRWPDTTPVGLTDAEIPGDPGVYVLGTADGTMLTYPWASSPVYYIGKADNLATRLANHRHWTEQARQDFWSQWWWPRYQYGAAFGADVAWFLCKQDEDAAALEAAIVDSFYMRFGSIPTANSSWPRKPSGGD